MPRKLEYDFSVQRSNRATGAGFALAPFAVVLLGFLLTSTAGAQVNGMPASVTSPGFGGRQVNGVAPSVTSLGPRGYTPAVPTCCFRGVTTAIPNHPPNVHPHRRNSSTLPWGGAYAVPYYGYYDSGDDVAENPPDEQYNGGPTVFDRRGPGAAPAPPSAPHIRPEHATTILSPTLRLTRLHRRKSLRLRISLRPCSCSKTVTKWKLRTTQLSAARYTT